MINFPQNQGAAAWDNMLPQHHNKPTTEGFVKSFYPPLTDLTKALSDLRFMRGIETAEGAQLDGIGEIVGVSRFVPNAAYLKFFGYTGQFAARGYGQARYRKRLEAFAEAYILPDNEYRSLIKSKILLNNGHGTTEEIIAIAKMLLKANKVTVTRNAVASVLIAIGYYDFDENVQANPQNIVPGGSYVIGINTTDSGAVADPLGGTGARRLTSASGTGAGVTIRSAGARATEPGAAWRFACKVRSNVPPSSGSLMIVTEATEAGLGGTQTVNQGLNLFGKIDGDWHEYTRTVVMRDDTQSFQVRWVEGWVSPSEIELFDCQIYRLASDDDLIRPQSELRTYYETFLPVAAGVNKTVTYSFI